LSQKAKKALLAQKVRRAFFIGMGNMIYIFTEEDWDDYYKRIVSVGLLTDDSRDINDLRKEWFDERNFFS